MNEQQIYDTDFVQSWTIYIKVPLLVQVSVISSLFKHLRYDITNFVKQVIVIKGSSAVNDKTLIWSYLTGQDRIIGGLYKSWPDGLESIYVSI
jgi:hypothetical protein